MAEVGNVARSGIVKTRITSTGKRLFAGKITNFYPSFYFFPINMDRVGELNIQNKITHTE